MSSSVHPVDEKLPLWKLLFFGFQHVLAMYSGAVAVPLVLDQEIDNDRSQKGKKPFDRDGNNDKTIKRTVSTTDPDSGMFVKG